MSTTDRLERRLLSQQFSHAEKIRYHKQDIEVVDIQPAKLTSDVPLYVAPGWGATTEVYRQTILELALSGRRVLAANALPELLSIPITRRRSHLGFPTIEWQRADIIAAVIKQKNISVVDVVGHSESAVTVALAALQYPTLIRNLILVDPVSVARKRQIWRMLWRSLKEYRLIRQKISQEKIQPSHLRDSLLTHLRVLVANPVIHLSTIDLFLESRLPTVLRTLKKNGHRIAIIHGRQDQLFPINEIREKMNSSVVDIFSAFDGTHSELHLHPVPVTNLIAQALVGLEKSR